MRVTRAIPAGSGASPSNATPVVDGTGAAGVSALYSRADHVHPAYDLLGQAWNGGPYRESFPRLLLAAGLATVPVAATQVMYHIGIPVVPGDVITNINFRTGSTAAVSPTNWWVALFDNQATPAIIGQSADQLTAPIGATTPFTLAIAGGPFTMTTNFVYATMMFKAGTVPTMTGINLAGAASAGYFGTQRRIAGSSGSALTTTAPGTIASPTASQGVPYVVLT